MTRSAPLFATGAVLTSCVLVGVAIVVGVRGGAEGLSGREVMAETSLTLKSFTAEEDARAELVAYREIALDRFVASLDSANAHVSDASVSNDVLAGLRVSVSDEVGVQKGLISNSFDDALRFPGVVFARADMDAYVTEHSARLNELLASYDAELVAEKQRIAEVEIEAPRSIVPVRTGESPESRIARIAAEIGVTVPVYIEEGCSGLANVLGCYRFESVSISVTQLGLSSGDNSLRCTLLHENRHAWQHATGFTAYLPGESEADWRARMESDAGVNGCV